MRRRVAVLRLILYISLKGGALRRVASHPWVADEGGGRRQSRGISRSDEKQKTEGHICYIGGSRTVYKEHLKHIGTAFGEWDQSGGLLLSAGGHAFDGSGKENDTDVSKARCRGCTKTTDDAKARSGLCRGSRRPGMLRTDL